MAADRARSARAAALPRSARAISVRALAKINRTLQIVGVRPDGYHELRTTFQAVALHDRLTFTQRRGPFEIRCDEPSCPTDRSNLVWRAADLLWRARGRSGCPDGVGVTLEKRIPLQAGLGGGSSDGAAALRALAVLWRVRLGPRELRSCAQELGADVPFFVEGGIALGLDRGDTVFPLLEEPGSWVVLAIPDRGVSTVEAYGWWDEDRRRSVERSGPGRGQRVSVNDLEPSVARRYPAVRRMAGALARLGARSAAMSGSGSSVFGLFGDLGAAEAAAAALAGPRCRALVTRTVGRAEYQALAEPTRGLPRGKAIV